MTARHADRRPGLLGGSGRRPRVERVAKQLREEISRLMVTGMKDPRVRLASVSEVRLAPDLRSARVMVSAVGEDAERHAVVDALRHAEGYLRAQLGGTLENLKTAPRLQFELDESIAYSVHVSSMLRDLEREQERMRGGRSAGDAGAAADDVTTGEDAS